LDGLQKYIKKYINKEIRIKRYGVLKQTRKIICLISKIARLKIKEIDRDKKRQWMMIINLIVHEKSYLLGSIYEDIL